MPLALSQQVVHEMCMHEWDTQSPSSPQVQQRSSAVGFEIALSLSPPPPPLSPSFPPAAQQETLRECGGCCGCCCGSLKPFETLHVHGHGQEEARAAYMNTITQGQRSPHTNGTHVTHADASRVSCVTSRDVVGDPLG